MSQMLNCKPIFKCDHTVDSSAMVQVTLKINYDDGTSNKKNVHMIQLFGDMEDILFCIGEFKRAANCLGCDHADKFENFGSIVSGQDCDNWTAACKKWPSVCVTGFHMLEIPDSIVKE